MELRCDQTTSVTARPSTATAEGIFERAIKAWGRDSPDTPEKPHICTIGKKTCTIGKKFWFSDSGGCTIAGVVGREKKRAEERLWACRVLGPEEEIHGAMEAVSFDDTLGKLREAVGEGPNKDQTILVCSEKMTKSSPTPVMGSSRIGRPEWIRGTRLWTGR